MRDPSPLFFPWGDAFEVFFTRRTSSSFCNFDLFDIERVEVLRGPQGTLFGRNTTAGLVQVITKDPTHDFELTVQAGMRQQSR